MPIRANGRRSDLGLAGQSFCAIYVQPIEIERPKALGCSWAGSRTGKRFEIKEQEALTAVQILGALIAVAGVVWAFIHPTAKGEGEASYAGITLKSLTQGGLILVIGALLVYFGAKPKDDDLTLSEWATQANAVCANGYDRIDALNIPDDPAAQFQALPQTTQITTEINQELQAIGRPSGAEAQVDQLLQMASQSNVEARRAYYAWNSGDTTVAQTALSEAHRLAAEVQALDGQLGAGVCALGG